MTATRSGKIKWYDVDRGFGFIVPDDGGDDVRFFGRDARQAGLVSVAGGQRLQFEADGTIATMLMAEGPNLHPIYRRLVRRAAELRRGPEGDGRNDAALMGQAAAALLVLTRETDER